MRRRYADAVALDVLAAERKEIQRLSAVVVVVFSAALELFAEAERSEALSLRHFYAALYRLALGLCRIEKRLVALGIVARLLRGSLGTVVICILCLKQQLLAELLRAVLHDNSPSFCRAVGTARAARSMRHISAAKSHRKPGFFARRFRVRTYYYCAYDKHLNILIHPRPFVKENTSYVIKGGQKFCPLCETFVCTTPTR